MKQVAKQEARRLVEEAAKKKAKEEAKRVTEEKRKAEEEAKQVAKARVWADFEARWKAKAEVRAREKAESLVAGEVMQVHLGLRAKAQGAWSIIFFLFDFCWFITLLA